MSANTVRLHRVLRAPPERIYRAFLDAAAMTKWLPPNGFTGHVHHLDAKAGGAHAARQYLAAGLVDEMEINLAPTLFGSGERLFDGVGDNLHGLEPVRTVAAPKLTHLKFAKR